MIALRPAILALGATQIVGYGTCYYSYAILAPAVARDLQITPQIVFGIFSAALLAGGLISPLSGKLMDRFGSARLMSYGSPAVAALLFGLSASPNVYVFGALVIMIEIAATLVLYNAAFATLAQIGGGNARRAITYLTLIAGFASTLFWPLSGWLLGATGWRATFDLFAVLNLLVAFPLHIWLARFSATRGTASPAVPTGGPAPAATLALSGREGRIAFIAVAISFALSNLVAASFAVHLVSTLQMVGLGTSAYAIAMVMGPSQVLIRLTDAVFWKELHPLTVAIIGASALAIAPLCLLFGQSIAIAVVFAALFGFGQGLESIVAGTVPLVLFERQRYGEYLGRLAAARLLLGAAAPFAFAALVATVGLGATLAALAACGLVAVAPLLLLGLRLRASRRVQALPSR